MVNPSEKQSVMPDTLSPDMLQYGNSLLESLSTAVLVLDKALCVRYANPAAEQLFATGRAHLQGQKISYFFCDGDRGHTDLQNALNDWQPYTRREALLHLQGHSDDVTVDYTVTPIGNAASERQLLIELQPLGRLMRFSREDSLLAAHQATRALVSGLAHEIKNPLGGIRGAAQLLARILDDSGLREYTDIIINETDRLRTLVDRMLGPRRLPDFKKINIHQVLERVRVILQAEAGEALELERDYDPSLPDVWADMDQLIQVVLNVLRNAAQSVLENPMKEKPCIVIRSRALRQLMIGTIRHRLVCLIEIEDNGPGISDALRETLFYPMVTGRSEGTGLGLPIAQSIMQQHGGLIECESRPGCTVFKILIPFEPVGIVNEGSTHAL